MKKTASIVLVLTFVCILASCGAPKPPRTLSGTKWMIQTITEGSTTEYIEEYTNILTFSDTEVTLTCDYPGDEYDQVHTYSYTYAGGVATVYIGSEGKSFAWKDYKLDWQAAPAADPASTGGKSFTWKDGQILWQDAADTVIALVPTK